MPLPLLPFPEVPDLEPENYLDLDKLGNANLTTYISYPEMAAGSSFWPNWRGCSVTGEVKDFFDTEVVSEVDYPEKMLVSITNSLLRGMDQGWVFYSYRLPHSLDPTQPGEESLRRFFYVGKPAASGNALPVPQCKESHDLCLDPELLEKGGEVTFVTVPYRAMQEGDKVTLTLNLYFDEDTDDIGPLVLRKTLTAEEAGQPLLWSVTASELLMIEGGYALMSYSIDYADPTVITTSARQTLSIITPPSDLLPALSVKDSSGDWLDPDEWLNGVTLEIPLYPGIQTGDDVLLYVTGGNKPLVKTLRVDSSTIASKVLQVAVEHSWLYASRGKTVTLFYQYARVGKAGTSDPFSLELVRKQNLPPPIVEGAEAEAADPGEYKGYIPASKITNGVTIFVPDEVDLGPDDVLTMHWEGVPGLGSHVAGPSTSNPFRFYIPAQAVPANLSKTVRVYYTLTPSGGAANRSAVYDLEVRPLDFSYWPQIQALTPLAPSGKLPLDQVPDDGAVFRLDAWAFMAEDQRVRIKAAGLGDDGTNKLIDLRVDNDEFVTEEEYQLGKILVRVPKAFLSSLKLNEINLQITVDISFDEQFSYIQLPGLPDLQVISSASSVREK